MITEEEYEYRKMQQRQRQREQIRARNRRKRRNQVYLARFVAALLVLFLFTGGFLLIRTIVRKVTGNDTVMETVLDQEVGKIFDKKRKRVWQKPAMQEDFLTVNPYSRPGEALPEVNDIFVHYTANAGTTAAQNKSYFQNLATTGETSASAHFIIGYDGEIIQCIPLEEIAYAVKGRNYDSISIECCYLDENGAFTDATYQSLIQLVSWLLGQYNLSAENVLRHYDEGGKNCPKYYVEHEEAWRKLTQDITYYIESYGTYDEEGEETSDK